MESYLIYIGKSAIASGAFYLLFLALFQNQKQFVFNRIYLPVSLAISFIIPLFTFTTIEYIEAIPATTISSFTYLPSSIEVAEPVQITFLWYHYLFGLYILGIIGFIFHLVLGHLKAMSIIRYSRLKELFGAEVNVTPRDVHPFSFFNKIVVSEKTLDNPNLEIIVSHELIHVREKHTLDILFAEILFLFQWFNPFAWLLKDAIKNNLEYKTDHQITKSNNSESYQLAMVGLADKEGIAPFLTAFNGSQLKNRIIMMKKKTENKYALLKQLVVLPLLAILVMGLSTKEVKTEIIQPEAEKNVEGQVISREGELPLAGVGIYNKFGDKLAESDSKGKFAINFEETKDNIVFVKEGFKPQHIEVDVTKNKEQHVTAILEVQFNIEDEGEQIEKIILDYKHGEKSLGEVLHKVDKLPEFPGGERELNKYIAETMRYPNNALEKGIQGDAYVTFIVDSNGEIVAPRLSRGVDPSLDEEALRIVNSFPEWKAGIKDGENVNTWYTIPVEFRIKENHKQYVKVGLKGELKTEYVIKGKVTNKKGEPVSAVSVLIKGKSIGTVTDLEGNYIIKCDEAIESLIFATFGHRAREIKTHGKAEVNVTLEYDKTGEYLNKNEIFYKVEEMPQFPGGEEALKKFIKHSINYPEIALEKGIIGTVYVNFIIGKDGKVAEPKISKGVDPSLNKEALRVVSGLPLWKPGKQNGKIVNTYYTVPVEFEISVDQKRKLSKVGLDGETITKHFVEGKVINENKEPIPGASVLIKGKAIGTITDNRGRYKLEINDINETLILSCPGYLKREIQTQNRNKIDVLLFEDKKAQNKAKVVNGYATKQEAEISNNIANGKPLHLDFDSKDRPLTIVDGIETNNIEAINPNDIEEVSVLKDASARAIYGEKGKNGVILISTKKKSASTGPVKIQLRGNSDKQPLFMVDGRVVRNLDEIDPEDIKSIDVLKGESSLSLYGEKGKNGVIVVTTKRTPEEKGELPVVLNGKMTHLFLSEVDRDLIKHITRIEPEEAIKKYGDIGKNGVFEVTSRKVYTEKVKVKSSSEIADEGLKITSELQLRKFIAQEIRYPKETADAGISGTVSVIASIDKDGNVIVKERPTYPDKMIDEIVVTALGHEKNSIKTENEKKALYLKLEKELERVVKTVPKVKIDQLMGKTIGIRTKFVLQ